jgi:hypothetical protein
LREFDRLSAEARVPSVLWVLGSFVTVALVAVGIGHVAACGAALGKADCVELFGASVPSLAWNTYVLLGLSAAAIVALALLTRLRPGRFRRLRGVPLVLSLVAIGAAFDAIVVRDAYYLLAIVALHWTIQWLLERRAKRAPSPFDLMLIFVSWAFASPISWYQPISAWLFGGGPTPTGPLTDVIFCACLLLVVVALRADQPHGGSSTRARVFDSFALVLFALFAFRQDTLPNDVSQHHWGFYVGPAELVRQGGWLLWDVPSQYGFLNILSIAALPFRSAWLAMYLLNGTLILASAAMVYFLLRLVRLGRFSLPFVFLATLVVVFLIPGDNQNLSGPQFYPSVGAIRFFWVEILIVFLVWLYLRPFTSRRIAIVGGSLLWLCGTLWAAESAVYVTFVWFPSLFLIVVGSTAEGPLVKRLRALLESTNLALLATPLALFGVAIALIHVIYVISLGHGPDYSAFIEYARSYGGGFGYLPMNPYGAVSMLVLAFAICVSVAAIVARHSPNPLAAAPVLWAAAATTWITSSYFIGRSADSNVTNIFTSMWLALAAILIVLDREGALREHVRSLRLALVAPLAVAMVMTLGNTAALSGVARALSVGYTANIPRLLPALHVGALNLLALARVRESDAIVYDGNTLMPQWPGARADEFPAIRWLPANPSVDLVPIPAERRMVYFQRFTSRRPMEGWFLRAHAAGETCESFDPAHVTVRSFTSPDWDLSLCYLAKRSLDKRNL